METSFKLIDLLNLLAGCWIYQFLRGVLTRKTIATYTHNWPLQVFSQDCGLASQTTYVVCINFIREWWDLQFNVESDKFLRSFWRQFHLLSEFLAEINWEKILKEIFFFILSFDAWSGIRTRALSLINQHTIY